uniref:RHS repeat-associated core domain-containing protein n=1 Tax=Isoptericola sp. BMS4 TaxID=2527875 RepID=UPI00141F3DC2
DPYLQPATPPGLLPTGSAKSQVTGSGGASGEVSSFGYDAAGNMTSRDVAGEPAQSLSWDPEGELTRVAEGSQTVGEYTYTPDGDRLLRTEGGRTTLYLPGGTELTADGSSTSAVRYYQFGGRTVAARTGRGSSGTSTVVADHQGTGVVQVDQSSNTLSRRYSDPYGGTRKGGAWTGDHGFLDKPTDSTGLVHVGARYYDPALGRFISVDPVMDLSDPQQWNAYSYSNNNPVTWSDPSGELPIGAGHVGYNPHDKTDKRKYDRCSHAISCEKDVRRGGKIVRVRENYTDHAVDFFSKSKNKTTKYTVNKAHSQDGARAAAKAAAASAEAAKAAEKAAREAEKKAADQAQSRSLFGKAWDGFIGWASSSAGAKASTWLSAISLAAGALSFVPGLGIALGVVSVATGFASAAIDCAGGGLDVSCGVGLLGASFGAFGFAARGVSKFVQPIAKSEINNADITSFGLSAPLAVVGFAGSALDRRSRVPGW